MENRARRKAMKAAIDAMPPFRRVTGPTTRQHIKARLRAALNDAIGQQVITFNPAAHVEIGPVRKPKALVWTDRRVARWEQTGEKPRARRRPGGRSPRRRPSPSAPASLTQAFPLRTGRVTRHAPSNAKTQASNYLTWGFVEPLSGFEPETYALRGPA
ncbi:hypothetical protein LK08_18930 [Streptomyces sp. MUSC 125]|nr:hypothetical protein LK08_18930 [Streptomyces sp. MUSC 125]